MDTAQHVGEQAAPEAPSVDHAPAGQDEAGTPDQQREVGKWTAIANRRLTAQQRAEAERDEAQAEIDRLRAEIDAGYERERADYLQQPWAAPEALEAAGDATEGDGEVTEGEAEGEPEDDHAGYVQTAPNVWVPEGGNGNVPFPTNEELASRGPIRVPNQAPRQPAVPFGSEPTLEQARLVFSRAAEAENARMRDRLGR